MNRTKGGKVIGLGTYGCVFKPSIPCDTDTPVQISDTVSKVFLKDSAATQEMQELIMIQKIDPEHIFTIPIITKDLCDVTLESFKPSDEADKCSFPKNKDVFKQVIMKYGGVSLDKLDITTSYETFFRKCHSLFYGLAKLQEAGRAHLDMTTRNIVFDGERARIIDFGLSCLLHDVWNVYERSYLFTASPYHYYPPEMYAFGFLVDSRNKQIIPDARDLVHHLIKMFDRDHKILSYLNVFYKEDLEGFGYELIHETQHMTIPELEQYFSRFVNIDIYGTGYALAKLYYEYRIKNGESFPYIKFFIKEMLQMHPLRRIHPDDALHLFESFFRIKEKKERSKSKSKNT